MVRGKIGVFLIVLGVLLGLAAASIAGYNLWDSYRAGLAADNAVQILVQYREGLEAEEPEEPNDEDPEQELPWVEIDGNRYIGTISAPSLGVELPVLEDWSLALLKLGPCRYMGSPYTGDLIICAHNYTTHFGRIGNLAPGDTVIFTDVEGNAFTYSVTQLDTIAGTAVQEMESGEWDLTLFTCTLGGQTRMTVRCTAVD